MKISCSIEPVTNGKKLSKQYFMFMILAFLLVLSGFRNRRQFALKDEEKSGNEL
jgi:hypothetical protein